MNNVDDKASKELMKICKRFKILFMALVKNWQKKCLRQQKLRVFGDIVWRPSARLCLTTQNIFQRNRKKNWRTNLGIFSKLTIFLPVFFLIFLISYTRRIWDEKCHRKFHYTFQKKTVYFKNFKKSELYCPFVLFFIRLYYIVI